MTDNCPPPIALDSFWPYRVVVLADQISRHTLSVVRAEAGLNLSKWRVLAAVAEKPGRTAADVTAITPMDKTIVSRAVASLIEDHLILKSATTADKRRHLLSTTPEGQDIYDKIAAKLSAAMVDSISEPAEIERLMESLKVFSGHMDKITP